MEEGSGFRLDSALQKAGESHMKGYNCAESVVLGLSQYWSLDFPIAAATGFGGGIARSGGICGALTGAIIAMGVLVGRVDPADEERKLLCYRMGQDISELFVRAMGASTCKEIIGFVLGQEGGSQRYADGGFRQRRCAHAIETAIRVTVQVAEANGFV